MFTHSVPHAQVQTPRMAFVFDAAAMLESSFVGLPHQTRPSPVVSPTPEPVSSPATAPPVVESVAPGAVPSLPEVPWPVPVDVLVNDLDIANVAINLVIAIATIGTLVWAISSTKRQLSLATDEIAIATSERAAQVQERARQSERERQLQAEHVAAWSEQEPVRETVDHEEDGRPITTVVDFRRTIFLVNTSNAPVWDVTVEYKWSEDSGNTQWKLPILVPAAKPQETWALGLPSDFNDQRLVTVRFRDAAGYVWKRDKDGELHLIQEPGPASAAQEKP
jgi:hypothetical protein